MTARRAPAAQRDLPPQADLAAFRALVLERGARALS